jgi:WD40 repeat protein
VWTYDVRNKFAPKHKMKGNSGTISHLDFSMDGRYLMTNSNAYEILFYSTETGKQETRGASMLKDEQWASWTCILGFPVQGIFPPCADGSDINAVARSPDGTVSATGDDFGTVKLFRYPCPVEEAAYQKYNGHSSHVTNVEFTRGAAKGYVLSTGGEDKSIFQWRLK